MSFPMQSRALVVKATFPVLVASRNGAKMISGSGRFGSCCLISSRAFFTDWARGGTFLASLEVEIASRADTTKTMELMVVAFGTQALPFTHLLLLLPVIVRSCDFTGPDSCKMHVLQRGRLCCRIIRSEWARCFFPVVGTLYCLSFVFPFHVFVHHNLAAQLEPLVLLALAMSPALVGQWTSGELNALRGA